MHIRTGGGSDRVAVVRDFIGENVFSYEIRPSRYPVATAPGSDIACIPPLFAQRHQCQFYFLKEVFRKMPAPSFTVMSWFTARSLSVSIWPLGQRISIVLIVLFLPTPKWTR